MIALFTSILLASLAGSFHCVAMCGPFVACGVGGVGGAPSSSAPSGAGTGLIGRLRRFRQFPYHLGRLFSYGIVGGIAGGFGSLLDRGGLLAGIQRTAMLFAAAALVAFGVAMLLQRWGVLRRIGLPQPLHRLYVGTFAMLQGFPPALRAGSIGALSALLPCGWLYAFAILAAGSGSPLNGALSMVAFWLGTMPLLLLVGSGTRWIAPRLRERLPAVAAWILIGAGIYGLAIRWDLPTWDSLRPAVTLDDASTGSTGAPQEPLPSAPTCH